MATRPLRLLAEKADRVDRNVFPDLLCVLDEVELVQRFLVEVLPVDGTVQLGKSFVKFCQQHGWATFDAGLTKVLETMTLATVGAMPNCSRCCVWDATRT